MLDTPRLITRVDVMQQLLASIAAEPEGEKIHLGRIRSRLLSQADIVKGIQTLIAANELDPQTLRPIKARPLEAAGAVPSAGPELAAALVEYARRHGLAINRISKHLFGGASAISRLTHGRHVQPRTAAKIAAFLAAEPPPGLQVRPKGGPRVAAVKASGAELAAQLDAMIAEHGLSKSAVGVRICGARHGVELLRRSNPQQKTVDKVKALLADPPLDELRRKRPVRSTAAAAEAEAPARITGADLASEIDAFMERTGARKGRVSNMLFESGTGIDKLRQAKAPKAETIDKVRVFIASPPADLLDPPARKRRASPSLQLPRDPPQRPATPLMEASDRVVTATARKGASIRRAQEEAAAAKLDAGAKPKNSFERGLMNQVAVRREEEARLTDPVEVAKTALRCRGRVVFNAAVHGGRKGRYIISGIRDEETGKNKQLTAAELFAIAKRVNPSAMAGVEAPR